MLIATDLRKSYAGRQAVDGVSLRVAAGEVLALLGPNGAGKSTTVGMVAGLVQPDSGQITLGGVTALGGASALGGGSARGGAAHVAAYKRRVGLVPQDIALYDTLGALANVELFGALYGLPAALRRERGLAALTAVGLADRAGDAAATFSGGMKRRLNIACALVHDPDVLLLDEPTAGVDPQSRNAIFGQIEALKARGKAIVYTTHYMDEVERLADRIVVIDHGRIVAEGTLHALLRQLPAAQTLEVDCAAAPGAATLAALAALPGVRRLQHDAGRVVVGLDDLAVTTAHVLQALSADGVAVRNLSSGQASLEDVFLQLTGRQLRD